MPTGYTAAIKDGISFETFIWSCARQFGALIMMSDDPHDAPIPEKFEPSDYHIKEIAKLQAERKRLVNMTEAKAEKEAQAEFKKELEYNAERISEANATKKKYSEMLLKVRAWQPPTPDHIGLKDFMIQQIESSIDFDCDTKYYLDKQVKMLTGKEWLATHIKETRRQLQYHIDENLKEIERTSSRNQWINDLRESLK